MWGRAPSHVRIKKEFLLADFEPRVERTGTAGMAVIKFEACHLCLVMQRKQTRQQWNTLWMNEEDEPDNPECSKGWIQRKWDMSAGALSSDWLNVELTSLFLFCNLCCALLVLCSFHLHFYLHWCAPFLPGLGDILNMILLTALSVMY